MHYREAKVGDIAEIAALHADSWRRHYRGAYSDAFLDGGVDAERLEAWTDRLRLPRPNAVTVVAELDGVLAGFAHTILEDDATWGALLDNLHVRYDLKRGGVGTRLLAESARATVERNPSMGLYLWVLEQNTDAQAFYDARGGRCVGREGMEVPTGDSVVALRYAWADPAVLVADT